MNIKKINKLKKQRGRSFEVHIKELFDSHGFASYAIGSNSKDVPDIVAWHDKTKTVIAVEAKSTASKYCRVPTKQIQRCIDWVNELGLYDVKFVILAFKFKGLKKKRELKYYYKIIEHSIFPGSISCNYDGICSSGGKNIQLEDFEF